MSLFPLRLCTVIFASVSLSPTDGHDPQNKTVRGENARAYNNPYHPEDDGIIENISDEDGDNLRFGDQKLGALSESEKIKIMPNKKQKINGRYYDIPQNTPSGYEENK